MLRIGAQTQQGKNVSYRSIACGLIAAGIPLITSLATAQEASFKADHFEPLPAQSTELGSVSRSQTLGHLVPSAGVYIHFADDVLQVDRGGEVAARLIDEQLVVEPSLAIGLFERFQLGVIIPAIVYQSGEAFAGVRDEEAASAAIGDLRIVPKVQLLSPDIARGFGIALAAPVGLPTGSAASFATDGTVRVEPRAVVDYLHSSGFTVAANVGFLLRPQQESDVFAAGNALRWGAGAAVPVADTVHLYGTAFGSTSTVADIEQFRSDPAEWNTGVRLLLPGGLLAQVGGGTGISKGAGAPDFRIHAGLTWSPRDQDSDGDGLFDSVDECPETPGPVDNNGCPYGDQDGDGILDPDDKCPQDAEDKDNFQDEDGCPDYDNDKDGIPDPDDKCPLEAEVINGVEDDDGCPDEGESKVRLTETKIEILEKVYFDTNKATIKPESFNLLRQVGATLRANTQILEVRVEGHTDSRGSDDYNLKLSQERAGAVRDFLIEYGIAADRLTSVGHGETKPVADNDTSSGRDRNRRVEFNIVRTENNDAVNVKEAQ